MAVTFEPRNIPESLRAALLDAAKVFQAEGYTFEDGQNFMEAAKETFLEAMENEECEAFRRSIYRHSL